MKKVIYQIHEHSAPHKVKTLKTTLACWQCSGGFGVVRVSNVVWYFMGGATRLCLVSTRKTLTAKLPRVQLPLPLEGFFLKLSCIDHPPLWTQIYVTRLVLDFKFENASLVSSENNYGEKSTLAPSFFSGLIETIRESEIIFRSLSQKFCWHASSSASAGFSS